GTVTTGARGGGALARRRSVRGAPDAARDVRRHYRLGAVDLVVDRTICRRATALVRRGVRADLGDGPLRRRLVNARLWWASDHDLRRRANRLRAAGTRTSVLATRGRADGGWARGGGAARRRARRG